MKPSDVVIIDPVPLTATFGKCEREVAAAYLLLTMRGGDDTFRPVLPREVGTAVENHKGKPGFVWLENPFAVPDFDGLLKAGYVERTKPEEERSSPLAFTDKGIEKLRTSRWVRRPP